MDQPKTEIAGVNVTRDEWRWALVVALIIMAFSSVPYIVGALNSTAEWHFSGFLVGVEDGNSYIAKMLAGAHGAWLFQLPYTPEPHPPVFMYSFYIWLGKLAGALAGSGNPLRLHTAMVTGYHAARIVTGAGMLLVAYRFLAEFVAEVRLRRLGLLLIALGGGLGWALIPLLGTTPIELYVPEAFTFLILYSLPHLIFARLFWVAAILAYLQGLRVGRLRWAWLAGVLWLVSGFWQPIYLLIAYITIFLHFIGLMLLAIFQGDEYRDADRDPRKLTLRALYSGPLAALPSLPLFVYTGLIFFIDPVFGQWRLQLGSLPPAPSDYLIAWGLLMVAAALGIRALWRRNLLLTVWVLAWFSLIPFVIYIPSPLQRRLSEAIQWPLVGLALLGLSQLPWARLRRWAPVALLIVTIPGSLLTIFFGTVIATDITTPVFIPDYRVQAYVFLAERLPVRALVVAEYDFGNALPAYAPVVSYLGHGPETAWLAQKSDIAAEFYHPLTDDWERNRIWEGLGAPYFVVGPDESAEYGGFDPSHTNGWYSPLNLLYAHQGLSIWALDDS